MMCQWSYETDNVHVLYVYSIICVQYYMCTVLYVYSITCVHYYMCTVLHVYSITCVHYYMCTVLYVYSITCVQYHMCTVLHVYSITCVQYHMCTVLHVYSIICVQYYMIAGMVWEWRWECIITNMTCFIFVCYFLFFFSINDDTDGHINVSPVYWTHILFILGAHWWDRNKEYKGAFVQ